MTDAPVDLDELEDEANRAQAMFPFRMGIRAATVLALIAEVRAARAVSQEASGLRAEVERLKAELDEERGRASSFQSEMHSAICRARAAEDALPDDETPPADEVAGLTEAERDVLSVARAYAANPTDMNGILLLKFAEELRENHLKGKR